MNPLFANKSFISSEPPAWMCPTCEKGRLGVVGKLVLKPNSETKNNSHEDWWDHEYAGYIFNGTLECAACGENVAIAGIGYESQEYLANEGDWSYVTMLTPTYFYPPLRVISPKVNDQFPFEITQLLQKAHEVCWADPDSALNRLRSIVEELLDFKGVRRANSEGKFIALHRRIELFDDPAFEQVQKALLAIKYVGNDGSHGFSGVNRRELLEIFSIVNYCLEKIFPLPLEEDDVLAAVTRINANCSGQVISDTTIGSFSAIVRS